MKAAACVLLALSSGCQGPYQLELRFDVSALNLAEILRMETRVSLAPEETRQFLGDQPYRTVTRGVGWEVRDFTGTGRREVLVTHDGTLGFEFAPEFAYVLLPPQVEAPPLVIKSRVFGPSEPIGSSPAVAASFDRGAVARLTLADDRCSGRLCAAGESCCDGTCIDVRVSSSHCGACGTACDGRADGCSDGACRCRGGSACETGKSCCPAGCFDLDADPFNCGACGKTCGIGESCVAGGCRCGAGAACPTGDLCCNGACATGTCPCGASPCGAPSTCCDAALSLCVSLSASDAHCGRCGSACTAPLSCVAGNCACNGVTCTGSDACCSAGCRNLANDAQNCGTCGKACANSEVCASGVCKCGGVACAPGQTCCGAVCADRQISTLHCGVCGKQCRPGEACVGGQCKCNGGPACGPSQTCCGDGCHDLATSAVHCGACANGPCSGGQTCQSGQCMGAATSCNPNAIECSPCGYMGLNDCRVQCNAAGTAEIEIQDCGPAVVGGFQASCCNGVCVPTGCSG